MAVMNEVKPPIINAVQSIIAVSSVATSRIFTEAAKKVIGMANKKEKREAASLVRPSNKPAVIVAPERDVPGTNASAWQRPITRTKMRI